MGCPLNTSYPPPPPAHARPCLSTGWALNRRFKEILGPLFSWSRMEDWVFVERLHLPPPPNRPPNLADFADLFC